MDSAESEVWGPMAPAEGLEQGVCTDKGSKGGQQGQEGCDCGGTRVNRDGQHLCLELEARTCGEARLLLRGKAVGGRLYARGSFWGDKGSKQGKIQAAVCSVLCFHCCCGQKSG